MNRIKQTALLLLAILVLICSCATPETGDKKYTGVASIDLWKINLNELSDSTGISIAELEKLRNDGFSYIPNSKQFQKDVEYNLLDILHRHGKLKLDISPNPTNTSTTAKIEVIMSEWFEGDYSEIFPVELKMELYFEDKMVWQYEKDESMGIEIIPEHTLQKPGTYTVACTLDGTAQVVGSFLVVGKKY